jgi:hypothetical protein
MRMEWSRVWLGAQAPNDGENRIDDVTAVINNYRADDPPATNKYDRTGIAGANDWNLGPPNGLIRIDDVTAIIAQNRHDCGEGDVWPPKPTPFE